MINDMGYGWGMGWGIILGLVILVVLIYTVVALRKQVSRKQEPGKKPPLELLKEKYARGEISKEEYETRKKKIK